jgi:hypothetical protein
VLDAYKSKGFLMLRNFDDRLTADLICALAAVSMATIWC